MSRAGSLSLSPKRRRRRAVISIAGSLLGVALTLLPLHPVQAATPSPLAGVQLRQRALSQVKAKLNSSIADALAAQDRLKQALDQNRAEQDLLNSQIADMDGRIATLEKEVKKLEIDIAVTQRRIVIERLEVRAVARIMYSQPESLMVQLAQSNDLGEFVTRMGDMASAGARAKALKAKLLSDEQRLESEQKTRTRSLDEQKSLRSQVASKLDRLKVLQAQQESAVADLAAKLDETRTELAQVNYQSTSVASQITQLLQEQQQQIIAASMQPIWDQVRALRVPDSFPVGGDHSRQSRFIWPLPAAVLTQGFGPSPYWFEPPYMGYAHFHTGIDLAEPENSPTLSADDGVVLLAGGSWVNGQLVGYGNYVVIAHPGGVETMYAHLNQSLVRPGDRVLQGQPIGLEGSTGNSTGAHLHFEARVNGAMVDPRIFLPAGSPSPTHA